MKHNRVLSIALSLTIFALIISFAVTTVFSADEPSIVDEGECGESAFWKLDNEGTLTIYGNGAMNNYGISNTPWISLENQISRVIIEEGITSIGNDAFWGCSSLTSIHLPESVTEIGEFAFSKCESLSSVNIPYGVKKINRGTFYNCGSLTNIIIPESVTTIGDNSFYCCISLSSVKISNNVTKISYGTFYSCLSLESINIPENITTIEECAFLNCTSLYSIFIPKNVSQIDSNAFSHCNLSEISVSESNSYYDSRDNCNAIIRTTDNCLVVGSNKTVIPDDVKSIDSNAFFGRKLLTSIVIPDSVTRIGSAAFEKCQSLVSIIIPEKIVSIEKDTFYGCISLQTVTLPNGLTSINDGAFSGCVSIDSINLPDSLESIGSGAFYLCKNLLSIDIPDNVSEIGRGAFRQCYALSNVYLPSGIKKIENAVFYGCCSLSSVIIPIGVTTIGSEVFYDCSSLSMVSVPEGVVSIGARLFSNTLLTNIYVPESVQNVDSKAFEGIESIIYSGPLTGAPWGAKKLNGYVADGIFTYLDESRTTVIHCDTNYSGIVTIPEKVTKIADYAFSNCQKITGIIIPDSLVDVGFDVLYNSSIYKNETNWENGVLYYGGVVWAVKGNVSTYSIKSGTSIICERAFENRYDVLNVDLPSSLAAVGEKAFSGCTGLRNPSIPSTIKSVGSEAFKNVNNVNYVGSVSTDTWGALNYNGVTDGIFTYSNSYKKTIIGCSVDASGKVTVPDKVTSISKFAFYGCDKITDISLPFVGKSRESEGAEGSFGYIFGYSDENEVSCFVPSSIKRVEITDTEHISNGAFSGCDNIEEMVIPFVGRNENAAGEDGCFGYIFGTSEVAGEGYIRQRYSDNGFVFCRVPSSLKKITITEDKTIPYGAFYGLSSVYSVTLNNDTESIGKNSVYGTAIYNNYSNWDHEMLTLNGDRFLVAYDESKAQVFGGKIPTETVLVSEYCFEDATFSSVELNSELVYIGTGAFINCLSLEKVIGAEKLEYIGEKAFSGCLSLSSVDIPSSVKEVPSSAFDTPVDIIYDSDKADWKKLNVIFENATVYYTLRSENGNAIVVYCDDDVRFDAGNVEVKKVTVNTVEKADSITFNYNSQSGFYEYRDAVPYGIFDIKLINTNDVEIQPESGRMVTLKIRATDGFRSMLLKSLNNFKGEFEDVVITDGNIYYSKESKTPDCTTDEVITDEFLRLIHFYSEKFEGADYQSYDIKDVTLKDGYIVLKVPHFSEFSIVGKDKKIEVKSHSIVVGESVLLDAGDTTVTKYTFSGEGASVDQNGKVYGFGRGEVTVTAWNGNDAVRSFVITVNPCTSRILKYQKERSVDYRTSMKFHYDGDRPADSVIQWYVDGAKYGEGEEITILSPQDDFNIEVRVVSESGTVCSEVEKISVKHSFFDKLTWFFRNLFSKTEALIDQK